MEFVNPEVRKMKRHRRSRDDHYLVGIDQSFSNYAMVLFKNGVPIDRCVFHTGDPTTKKNSKKDPVKTHSKFFPDSLSQLAYLYECVICKLVEWNPDDISMEGISFGSVGRMERQLGALYFGIQVSLSRELGYSFQNLHTVTPLECKSIARTFLIGDDQYARDIGGVIFMARSKKPKLNPMKDKRDMLKALNNTPYGWLVDGYTRDGLALARINPTGLEDIPDAYFIGLHTLESKFRCKEPRITKR